MHILSLSTHRNSITSDVTGVWLVLIPLPPEATLRNWYNMQKNYKNFFWLITRNWFRSSERITSYPVISQRLVSSKMNIKLNSTKTGKLVSRLGFWKSLAHQLHDDDGVLYTDKSLLRI